MSWTAVTGDVSPVEVFRLDLLRLHDRAGRPSSLEMAKASGRPPGLFAFMRAPGVPGWDEVTALLTATGHHTPSEMETWRRRWRALDRQRRRSTRDPEHEELSEAQLVMRLREEGGGHQAGPINTALAAATPVEFVAALEQLRLAAGVSYSGIAQKNPGVLTKSTAHRMATGDKLPHRRDALVGFLGACGVKGEIETRAWWMIAQRIRRGEPPDRRAPSTPAAEQRQRDLGDRQLARRGSLRTMVRYAVVEVEAEVERLRVENDQLRQMLDSVVRAFRTVDAELVRVRSESVAGDVPVEPKPEPNVRRRPPVDDQPTVMYHADTGTYRVAG